MFIGHCTNLDIGLTNLNGLGCKDYTEAMCGQGNDADFKSEELCCICGGGLEHKSKKKIFC